LGRTTPCDCQRIEARLIVAEVRCVKAMRAKWLNELNALRADSTLLPVPQTRASGGAKNEARPVDGPGPVANDSLRWICCFASAVLDVFTGHTAGRHASLMRQYNRM